jgi:hypothetical protein
MEINEAVPTAPGVFKFTQVRTSFGMVASRILNPPLDKASEG